MKEGTYSRRRFIRRVLSWSPLLLSGVFLPGCKKKPGGETTSFLPDPSDCSDLSDLSENDKTLRQKFAYTDESPIEDNLCGNCNLYLPAQEGKPCGACMLFKGPVQKSGYCTYWAPKADVNI